MFELISASTVPNLPFVSGFSNMAGRDVIQVQGMSDTSVPIHFSIKYQCRSESEESDQPPLFVIRSQCQCAVKHSQIFTSCQIEYTAAFYNGHLLTIGAWHSCQLSQRDTGPCIAHAHRISFGISSPQFEFVHAAVLAICFIMVQAIRLESFVGSN